MVVVMTRRLLCMEMKMIIPRTWFVGTSLAGGGDGTEVVAVVVAESGNDITTVASIPPLACPTIATNHTPLMVEQVQAAISPINVLDFTVGRVQRNALAVERQPSPMAPDKSTGLPGYMQRKLETNICQPRDLGDHFSSSSGSDLSDSNESYHDEVEFPQNTIEKNQTHTNKADTAKDPLTIEWSAVPEVSGRQRVLLFKQRMLFKGSKELPNLTIVFMRLGKLLDQLVRAQLNLDEALELAVLVQQRITVSFSTSEQVVPIDLARAMDAMRKAANVAHNINYFRQAIVAVRRLQEQREALHSQRLHVDRKVRKNRKYQPFLSRGDGDWTNLVEADTSARTVQKVIKLRAALDRFDLYVSEVLDKAERVLLLADKPPICVADLQDAEFQVLHRLRVHIGVCANRNPAMTELFANLWAIFAKIMQHG